MCRIIIAVILLSTGFYSIGQSHVFKYEIQLVVENDAFTGSLTKDQYYSSGIYPQFRILKDSSANAKIIRTYQLNHRMYTPSKIWLENVANFDRPYAGLLSVSTANEYYYSGGNYLKVELELGVLGPHAFVGNAQRAWHRFFNMPHPGGWKYQIEDCPVINVYLKHVHPLVQFQKLELLSESAGAAGTVYNWARQEFTLRIGRFNPAHQSSYTSSSLGKAGMHTKGGSTVESYFFYAPGLEYVAYNATLQGNFIGNESPDTVDAINWIWQHRAGVMFSWPMFDFGLISYWRKKENPEARHHHYVGIRMNHRL